MSACRRIVPGGQAHRVWCDLGGAPEPPTNGKAELWCERDTPPVDDFIRFAANLSDAEKDAAFGASSSVRLQVPGSRRHLLRDRKTIYVTPRSMIAARRLRENADAIRTLMAEARARGE